MRFFSLILFLIAAFTHSALGTSLDGQAFIVTKGGSNIKLGLVTIGLYSSETVKQFVSKYKNSHVGEAAEWHKQEQAHAERSKAYEKKNQYDEASIETKAVITCLEKQMEVRHRAFGDFPFSQAITKTKTDADGKYHLEAPDEGELYIVAFTSRAILNKIEFYTWVLPRDEWESPLFLSNDNLFALQSIDPAVPELYSGNETKRNEAWKACQTPKS